ncbi:MAG: hypothetical protein ACOH1R_09555 [Luteimonas sp.]
MPIRLNTCLPVLATSLLLAMVTLSGCQKAQEMATNAAIERASDGKVKVSKDGDRTVIKSEGGEIAVQHGDALPLPRNFPTDIYLPKDYRINSVMDMGDTQVLSLQAPGKVGEMFGSASAAMEKQGWKQTMALQNSTDTAMLTYEKEKRAAVMSFNRDLDQDGVTMSMQLRGEQQ